MNEAVGEYEQALRLEGFSPELNELIAATLERLGRPEDAAAHYRQALRLDPGRRQAAAALARIAARTRARVGRPR